MFYVFWCTVHTGNWCLEYCLENPSECPSTAPSPTTATSNCSTQNITKSSLTTPTESPHITTKTSPSPSIKVTTGKRYTIVFCILVSHLLIDQSHFKTYETFAPHRSPKKYTSNVASSWLKGVTILRNLNCCPVSFFIPRLLKRKVSISFYQHCIFIVTLEMWLSQLYLFWFNKYNFVEHRINAISKPLPWLKNQIGYFSRHD